MFRRRIVTTRIRPRKQQDQRLRCGNSDNNNSHIGSWTSSQRFVRTATIVNTSAACKRFINDTSSKSQRWSKSTSSTGMQRSSYVRTVPMLNDNSVVRNGLQLVRNYWYFGSVSALHHWCCNGEMLWRHSHRTFSNYRNDGNSGSRSKSKRQQNYELSGQRIGTDPFVTLGIIRSPTLQYTSVKTTFLKIAMKYHPDTTTQNTAEERERNKDLFVTARKSFEAIIAGPGGVAILKTEGADYVEEEEDFEEWFKGETGYDMPFMDVATMREVAEMTETIGGGLDRDGGMWTLARMVANTVKEGGDGRSILQLDAGIVRDREIDGILRRRRRR